MPTLSPDAADTIKLLRELELMDETSIRLLEQLFTNRVNEDLVVSLIGGKEPAVAVSLFKVCLAAHSAQILGYALRFFADLVHADPSLGHQLGRQELVKEFGGQPAEALLQVCTANVDKLGIANPALYLAATALRYGEYESNAAAFKTFFAVVRHSFTPEALQVANVEFSVQACVLIARRKELRRLFFEEEMTQYIPRLLTDIVSSDSASIIQLIYEALLLAWLLSFEYDGIVELVRERMVPQLHRVLQRVQKEKCVRVALMTLWNMAEAERKYMHHVLNPVSAEWVDPDIDILAKLQAGCNGIAASQTQTAVVPDAANVGSTAQLALSSHRRGPSLVSEMVGVGMLKTLAQLDRRKYGDEDIPVLVTELMAALNKSMEVLTSFSEYRGEVLSKALEWTPVHTSAKFWKENAKRFEDNGYEVLHALGQIILTTHTDTTLAVACHDLGEVVRYHPSGRNLLTLPSIAGVKERVMELMAHPNPDVAKEALLCTQKIMVQRWEYIQR